MNVTSINHTSDAMPINQSSQDSHEMNLQKQISDLQGKMRDIAYSHDMSSDEKSNEKKALQEKIKSLNSELKQYQLRKHQKEAEKREAAQKEAENEQAEKARNTAENTSAATSGDTEAKETGRGQINQAADPKSGTGDFHAGTMVSTANTKEHLSNMQKIRTNLEGRLRTATTDEEKSKLQKRLNNVSRNMGEKIQKISDTVADTQKEDEARKKRVKKILKNFSDRMKNMNVSVPKSSKASPKYDGDWDDNSAMPGKVLLTRKKS